MTWIIKPCSRCECEIEDEDNGKDDWYCMGCWPIVKLERDLLAARCGIDSLTTINKELQNELNALRRALGIEREEGAKARQEVNSLKNALTEAHNEIRKVRDLFFDERSRREEAEKVVERANESAIWAEKRGFMLTDLWRSIDDYHTFVMSRLYKETK